MRFFPVEIPDHSVILDIGIEIGYTYSKNSDFNQTKNITVVGVDVDPEYVRRAKHTIIDSDFESQVRIVLANIYEAPENSIPCEHFDFVIFSDSNAVISEVHDMITFCEKYLNLTGQMVVTSTLFDTFNIDIDWIKQKLVYVSSGEFGKMMVREDLDAYIKTRYSGDTIPIQQNVSELLIAKGFQNQLTKLKHTLCDGNRILLSNVKIKIKAKAKAKANAKANAKPRPMQANCFNNKNKNNSKFE